MEPLEEVLSGIAAQPSRGEGRTGMPAYTSSLSM